LLALIIGFTFLMALTRYESRREAVLNEANAIGTTALRARLLPEPHRTDILKLLREYVRIRVDYIPSGKSFAQLPEGATKWPNKEAKLRIDTKLLWLCKAVALMAPSPGVCSTDCCRSRT
jgi:hypothetical protein